MKACLGRDGDQVLLEFEVLDAVTDLTLEDVKVDTGGAFDAFTVDAAK